MKLNKYIYIYIYIYNLLFVGQKIKPFGVMLAALKFGKFMVKSLLGQLLIEI